jgi:hypothetical protein
VGLDAGIDVLYVAELLGRSSPAITMNVYQHVRRERLAGAAQAIARRPRRLSGRHLGAIRLWSTERLRDAREPFSQVRTGVGGGT